MSLDEASADGASETFFSVPTSTSVATLPDLSVSFSLRSLKLRRGRTSITLSWLRDEWPCLADADFAVVMCPAEESDDDKACKKDIENSVVQDRRVATVQNLQPCSRYKV
jgi:hypothetical protein